MLSFVMTCDNRPEVEALELGFRKWMSAIEMDADKYDVKIVPGFDIYPNLGKLEVTYDNKLLFDVNFYRKYVLENGKKAMCGILSIEVYDEGKMLISPGDKVHLDIDNRLGVSYQGTYTNIVKALQDLLPVRDEKDVERSWELWE